VSGNEAMKVYSPDKSELMTITSITRQGSNLVISGKIMGSMPMKAVIRPEEARRGVKLVGFKTFLFLLTFLFRSSSRGEAKAKGKGKDNGR
jgi:hypothetical protein